MKIWRCLCTRFLKISFTFHHKRKNSHIFQKMHEHWARKRLLYQLQKVVKFERNQLHITMALSNQQIQTDVSQERLEMRPCSDVHKYINVIYIFYFITVSRFHMGTTDSGCDFGRIFLRVHLYTNSWGISCYKVWWQADFSDWHCSNFSIDITDSISHKVWHWISYINEGTRRTI